jgi:glycosyltransferase involved in cell wall biosynthesis
MVMLKLTVITSVYNSEFFIKDFLDDIRRQSIFKDCEFLFLDADSTDNCRQEILEFALGYKNVQYFNVGKKNIYETWNIGVSLSRSEILTNWNTDDRRLPNSLEKQYNFLMDNEDVDLCYGETLWVDTPNIKTKDCDQSSKSPCLDASMQTMLQFNSPHCLPMWRKSLHRQYGMFNETFFSAGDYEMWMRALSRGCKFGRLNEVVGSYYRNPKGISSNPDNLDRAVGEVMAIRKFYSQ